MGASTVGNEDGQLWTLWIVCELVISFLLTAYRHKKAISATYTVENERLPKWIHLKINKRENML
jgi:hypothetical protein